MEVLRRFQMRHSVPAGSGGSSRVRAAVLVTVACLGVALLSTSMTSAARRPANIRATMAADSPADSCGPVSGALTNLEGIASWLPRDVEGQPITYAVAVPSDMADGSFSTSARTASLVGVVSDHLIGEVQGRTEESGFFVSVTRFPGACGHELLLAIADQLDGADVDAAALPSPMPYKVRQFGSLLVVRPAQYPYQAVSYVTAVGDLLLRVYGSPAQAESFLAAVSLPDPAAMPMPTATPRAVPEAGDGGWFPLDDMPMPRIGSVPVLLPEGQVMVLGGRDSLGPTADVQLLDPITGAWQVWPAMRSARAEHAATLLPDGRVLVAGGVGSDSEWALASAEIFSPTSGVWTPISPLSERRSRHTLTTLRDGSVIASGGVDWNGTHPTAIERFYPEAGSWQSEGGVAIYDHDAVSLADGSVLFGAGSDVETQEASHSLWRYVPDEGGTTWHSEMEESGGGSLLMVAGQLVQLDCNDAAIRAYSEMDESWVSAFWVPCVGGVAVEMGDDRILVSGLDPFARGTCALPGDAGGTCEPLDSQWSSHRGGFGVTLPDGGVVLVGGYLHGDIHGTTEVFRLP